MEFLIAFGMYISSAVPDNVHLGTNINWICSHRQRAMVISIGQWVLVAHLHTISSATRTPNHMCLFDPYESALGGINADILLSDEHKRHINLCYVLHVFLFPYQAFLCWILKENYEYCII